MAHKCSASNIVMPRRELILGHSGIDAGGKLRPSVEELEDIGPHFKQRWEEYFQDASDKPVIFLGAVSTCVLPIRDIWYC